MGTLITYNWARFIEMVEKSAGIQDQRPIRHAPNCITFNLELNVCAKKLLNHCLANFIAIVLNYPDAIIVYFSFTARVLLLSLKASNS